MTRIEGYFDGVCEPKNPGGHAAWGGIVKVDGETMWRSSGYCGVGSKMSNNVAEYQGALTVMIAMYGFIEDDPKPTPKLVLRGDSKLVIM
jgi:ribonuclease HI